MNIKTIVIGSLALSLTIGGVFFNLNVKNNEAVYTPRSINNGGVHGNAGYATYLHSLKADPATGEIDYALVEQVKNEIASRSQLTNKTALGLNWTQMGPDNVGGRTRAILVDKDNSDIVYAGSVAGGLFVSTDASLTWNPVSGMNGVLGDNLAISCITQTDNGRIFFGTGSSFESSGGNGGSGFIGNGVYEYVPSTGSTLPVITNSTAVPNNNNASFWAFTNAIASYGNRLYLGTNDGMVWADPDGSGIYPTSFAGWTNPIEASSGVLESGICQDIDVSSDGSMMVCFQSTVYTSPDDVLGNFNKRVVSGSRLSGAIAPSNPNVYYLLRSSSTLKGLEITLDKGVTWTEIVPGGVTCLDPFRQNDCGTANAQGGYDDAIAVNPGDWGHIIVGGVQLFEWKHNAGSNPIGGSWFKSANLFEFAGNPYYVHADKHTVVWASSDVVYVGGDGGIARSDDSGTTWQARNFGYNVTTFYDATMASNGWILGGAQDNGTQLLSFGAFGAGTPLGTTEIMGGDGFDVAFSRVGVGIAYGTSQNGNLLRATPGGSMAPFYNNLLGGKAASGNEPFHTVIGNWENLNDTLSTDSVQLIIDTLGYVNGYNDTIFAGDSLFAGDIINFASFTNGIPLTYVVPADMVVDYPVDTFMFQDIIQTKFAVRFGDGVYLTNDAARFSVPNNYEWRKISTQSSTVNIEFSNDGNHVFLGTDNGKLYRVSGLSSVNRDDIQAVWDASITHLQIGGGLGGGGAVSIAVDPNNDNNLIVGAAGYSNNSHVYRCTNALTAVSTAGTFEAIQGSSTTSLPFMPVYAVEIDYTDNNKVIIGTEWGVWTADNAFSAASGASVEWTDENANGMAHVPVFAVEQQHLKSWQSSNSGSIYLGTHGRGFYVASDLEVVSVEENDFNEFGDKNSFATDLNVFPNPLSSIGTLSFKLRENVETTIKIYNLTGSLVKTIDLGMANRGEHKERFDVSSLSVGSYIISLESGSERKVAKFIITR